MGKQWGGRWRGGGCQDGVFQVTREFCRRSLALRQDDDGAIVFTPLWQIFGFGNLLQNNPATILFFLIVSRPLFRITSQLGVSRRIGRFHPVERASPPAIDVVRRYLATGAGNRGRFFRGFRWLFVAEKWFMHSWGFDCCRWCERGTAVLVQQGRGDVSRKGAGCCIAIAGGFVGGGRVQRRPETSPPKRKEFEKAIRRYSSIHEGEMGRKGNN